MPCGQCRFGNDDEGADHRLHPTGGGVSHAVSLPLTRTTRCVGHVGDRASDSVITCVTNTPRHHQAMRTNRWQARQGAPKLLTLPSCPTPASLHGSGPDEVFVSLIPANLPASHLAIAQEADRLHESALWSSQGQFEQAKLWRLINLILGVPAAALAAVSGGTALGGDSTVWPGVLALGAAALSATLTTVNASRRMTQAQASANAYLQLQTAVRQFLTIDMADMSRDDAREGLRGLTNTRDELNKTSDPPGRMAYGLAKRNIGDGGQTYSTDEGE
jgi:hypothetical protein